MKDYNNFHDFHSYFSELCKDIDLVFSDEYGNKYHSMTYFSEVKDEYAEHRYEIICTDPFSTNHSAATGLVVQFPVRLKDSSNEEITQFLRQVVRLYMCTFFTNIGDDLENIVSSMDNIIHAVADTIIKGKK